MSAWAGRVATHYFTAVLAVQIALSGASLPVFAQDQQDQQQRQPELQPQQPQPQPQQPQPQQQPLPSNRSNSWSRRLRSIPMLYWRRC